MDWCGEVILSVAGGFGFGLVGWFAVVGMCELQICGGLASCEFGIWDDLRLILVVGIVVGVGVYGGFGDGFAI